MPIRTTSLLWLVWVAVLAALTERVFRWHLDYFNSPGPNFHRIALIFVPGVAAAAWVYARLRQRRLWRYEPAALAILVLGACLRYEPRAAAVTAALFLACCALGRFVLGKLGLESDNPIDRVATGFGAGAGLLITALLAIGLLGLFYPLVFIGLLLVPPVVFRREAAETLFDIRAVQELWRRSTEIRHPIAAWPSSLDLWRRSAR